MKKTSHILPTLTLLTLPLMAPVYADSTHDHMSMDANAVAAVTHKGQGTVNKVDTTTDTINLTHTPIKTLSWSGMTMDFKVKDKSILNKIKTGTKVDFEISKAPDGTFVITRIVPAK